MTAPRAFAIAALGAALLCLAPVAAQARPARAACSIKYLPLTEGTVWTYEYVVPPESSEPPGPRTEPPSTLEIEVVEVTRDGKETTIKLEERYRDVVNETELRCDKGSLEVPPGSFFFAGEPGGGRGMSLTVTKREGDVFPGKKGLSQGDSFYVALVADLERAAGSGTEAVHAAAVLEIERQANVGGRESVETGVGTVQARHVEIVISGRAAVKPQLDKQVNMPETRSQLWFSKGLGLVRAYNHLGQGWQLADITRPGD